MTFLFEDKFNHGEYQKVTAQDEKEAILKVLKVQLDKELVSVRDICDNLSYALVNIDVLDEYE